MTEQDQQLSEAIQRERPRLWNFIRRRVPDPRDAEDILQDVFYRLVEANRLLMPIDHLTGWLYQVARNRIVDLFRTRARESVGDAGPGGEDEISEMEDRLLSPEAGPDGLYEQEMLMSALALAMEELTAEQRDVFVAHELEGRSFKEIAAATDVNVNTLLSRKRYAVLRLRERLRDIYDEFI